DYAAKVQAHDSALDDTVEIDLQSGLKHANIVKIIQWWAIDGALVIVMEFAPSGDIWEWLADRECLGEEEVWAVTENIGAALGYLHKTSISDLHRDIKPVSAADPATTYCGTPAHMYPELLEANARPYGPGFDAWALGVTLHELASGVHPFADDAGHVT
ncbi:NUAK SNF1-like kinase 2, partial [Tilletia horrida]